MTKELLERLAAASALELSETECEETADRLESILTSMELLCRLELSGTSPEVSTMPDMLREDRVQASAEREAVLRNAPETDGVYFAVPKTVE